jgi:predicted nucleotidyltransferase
MTEAIPFPGTPQHQALLRAIVTFYEPDPRVLAVIVFGSLGRGEWDALSDIDLDVVVADEACIQVADELRRLCASFAPLGEHAALIVPTGDDEADVVLESLLQLSVRYHPLASTKPAIVDSLRVLAGRLDAATIAAAAAANPSDPEPSPDHLLAACVRYAAVAQVYLQRASLWLAIEILHRMRSLLMDIFVRTHGGGRPLHRFPAIAPAGLQAQLGATLPQADPSSVRAALAALIDLLENDLAVISNGRLTLTAGQQTVLRQVRLRLGCS